MSAVATNHFPAEPGSALSSGSAMAAARGANTTDTPRQHKLRQAAQQFESMLMSNLWKSMKSSFDEDDSDSGDPAMGTLEDWSMQAMSGAVGKAGGLGIANLIMKDLEPKIASFAAGKEVSNS